MPSGTFYKPEAELKVWSILPEISLRAGKLREGSHPERGWKNRPTNQPTNQTNHTGLYGTSWLSTVSYLFLKFALHTPGHLGHYNFVLSERALDSESKEGASNPGSATSQAE